MERGDIIAVGRQAAEWLPIWTRRHHQIGHGGPTSGGIVTQYPYLRPGQGSVRIIYKAQVRRQAGSQAIRRCNAAHGQPHHSNQ